MVDNLIDSTLTPFASGQGIKGSCLLLHVDGLKFVAKNYPCVLLHRPFILGEDKEHDELNHEPGDRLSCSKVVRCDSVFQLPVRVLFFDFD